MKRLSKLVEIGPTAVRGMTDMAVNYPNAISFCLGQPDFPTPKNIVDAAIRSLEEGKTKYTLNSGVQELREAVSKKMEEVDNTHYDPETEVMITNGGIQALSLTMQAILEPGDEVIISNPCYTNFPMAVRFFGGVPVPVVVKEENGFSLQAEDLEKAITPRTKALLLNTPTNPTGGYEGRKNQEELAKIILKYDLYVIYDQTYKTLIFDKNDEFFSITQIPGMKERTFVCDTLSKTYSMTGWRIGYICGPKEAVQYMPHMQEMVLGCLNTTAQYAAIEALNTPDEDLEYMRESFRNRRDYVVERINGMGHVSCCKPLGAFYVFMNIKETGMSSKEFAVNLLKEKEVVVAPGDGFGSEGDGYVRITYATSMENLKEGLDRINDFVEEHFKAQ